MLEISFCSKVLENLNRKTTEDIMFIIITRCYLNINFNLYELFKIVQTRQIYDLKVYENLS